MAVKKRRIRVIFDLDGVIVLSDSTVHRRSWSNACERACRRVASYVLDLGDWDTIQRLTFGMAEPLAVQKMASLLDEICRVAPGSFDPAKLSTARMEFLRENWRGELDPVAYVREILEFCEKHEIEVWLVTNSCDQVAEWMLEKMGILKYFPGERRICANHPQLQAGHFKPQPDMWELARNLGKFGKDDIVFGVDDSIFAVGAMAQIEWLTHPVFFTTDEDAGFRLQQAGVPSEAVTIIPDFYKFRPMLQTALAEIA